MLKGREGYAPFDYIDDKHPHPSNVVWGCKVFYTHMFKVRVWKNARSPNNEKQKRLLWDKMGRVISACVRFGFYS